MSTMSTTSKALNTISSSIRNTERRANLPGNETTATVKNIVNKHAKLRYQESYLGGSRKKRKTRKLKSNY